MLGEIGTVFSLWTDTAARVLNTLNERFRPRPQVEFVQDADGFTLRLIEGMKTKGKGKREIADLGEHHVRIVEGRISDPLPAQWAAVVTGSRAELMLEPSGFLFRPLELPKRAGEFLEGIVRAQIDRLTPWNASEAVYHWTPPVEVQGDRIVVTVSATARNFVAPFVQAIAELGVATVAVSTRTPDVDAKPVTVIEQRVRGGDDLGRIRIALRSGFAASAVAAVLALLLSGFATDYYDEQTQQIQHQIAEHRAAIRAGQTGNSATALLEKRKHTTPASVMVMEELSAILPDNTYATELHIEGDKLQIVGVTQDAPSLIEILERSPHFVRATFFAPTTHAAGDPGDRFHIEAHIRPHFGIGT
jgi:general secretion pathway protein L